MPQETQPADGGGSRSGLQAAGMAAGAAYGGATAIQATQIEFVVYLHKLVPTMRKPPSRLIASDCFVTGLKERKLGVFLLLHLDEIASQMAFYCALGQNGVSVAKICTHSS